MLFGFVLKLFDEGFGLVATELATGLALCESHWAARVSKVRVARVVEQRQQFLYLLCRCRRTRLLTERHRQPPRCNEPRSLANMSRGSAIAIPLRISFCFFAVYGGYIIEGSSFVLRE